MNRLLSVAFALILAPLAFAQGTAADYERSAKLFGLTQNKVFKARVEPHWSADGNRFWYRNDLADKAREFIVVDAIAGMRSPAFDHAKLAAVLAKAAAKDVRPSHLPFDALAFDGEVVRFVAFDKGWRFDPKTNELTEADQPKAEPATDKPPQKRPMVADDSPWAVSLRDHNLILKNKAGGEEFALTKDGTANDGYSLADVVWSPDFTKLVALRIRKGAGRQVQFVESSPKDRLQPRLHTFVYDKPGDELRVAKPHLFDAAKRTEISVSNDLFKNPWESDRVRWAADSKSFSFIYNQRGHQVLRLIEVDAITGAARAIINEECKTFIDYAHKQFLHEIPSTGEVIWMSERDGWNHLYLYDRNAGTIKNQITKGEWVVRGVERVDDEKRQIWFRASGIYPGQDPYDIHYCRINFDGTGLVKLTAEDGTHAVRYSPDGRFFLDSYSRVDMAPVTELRRANHGTLVCILETADASALMKTGWRAPERFVAKGRDGKTDIHGVIYRPTNFDPAKKYPVIEQIYAGPQGSFVPKSFAAFHYPQEIAELGFVSVQIDGMGTSNRSKAFHDVCWKNLADAGFPDRILWLRAASAKYPSLDITRVGVYGGSAGGQNALGALLTHGDFYNAAAADCGCHDNRMDKVWWNELWMGYPIGPHYAEQSNVTLAHKLTGKLLLTVGELDRNVDPASTMQVVNALIKAGKDFELVVFPGADHGAGGSPYGRRRMKDFFVRHLLGVSPPDRNSRP